MAWSVSASASDGVMEISQTCAVETGCFAGDTAGFPVTINGTAGRSYRLTSDLLVPSANTTGISITASDIGIDLNNFAIRGPVACSGTPLVCTPSTGSGSGIAILFDSQSGISVRNGTIWGMGNYAVFLGVQAEAANLRVRSNRGGGIFVGSGSSVSDNFAYQNGGDGIDTALGSTVAGNAAYQNGARGIGAGTGSTVSGNTAYENGGDGIFANAGSSVLINTAYQNGGDGIDAAAGSTASGNTVRANTGFGLRLGSQSGYRENSVTSNTAGTVSGTGLVNLGNNGCNGSTTCP